MELNIIEKLIALLEENKFLKKIHLREGDFEISLEKDEMESVKKEKQHYKHIEKPRIEEEKTPAVKSNVNEEAFVLSPMVGTFYSASSPEHPPFVKVGDVVNENSVLCIIEAMKVMNEIKAGKKRIVKEVLIENGQPVEFGSKLFYIEA